MDQDEIVHAELVHEPIVDDRPVRWRELLVVLAVVALSDVTVYRGHGYSGYALLLISAPLLLLLGAPISSSQRRHAKSLLMVSGLLAVLVIKMVWCGWGLHIALGLALLCAFAVALSGTIPHLLEVVVFPSRMMLGGLLGLAAYTGRVRRPRWRLGGFGLLSIILPLAAFVAFSILFILANPDLLDSFGHRVEQLLTAFREWLIDFSPHPLEMMFWLAVGWIAIGMLRPLLSRPLFEALEIGARDVKDVAVAQSPSPLYAAARNTLVTVLVLFAIYLLFEFKTLWFRTFPTGFYYSGYAHQGAAWLTVALALATVVLSLVFRGTVLRDARLPRLRRLAWLWSLENILLAVAVYHRLYIYVGFNGMTRMRIVGILGISSVLVGFLLVLWKIAHNRGFLWLVHRHMWTVALAVYLFGVLPVDRIVVDYNVRRILTGDSAPAVQITEHPISSEGVLLLGPLLECDDAIVREGIRALLAQKYQDAEVLYQRQQAEGWTSFQYADHLLLQQLRRASEDQLAPYRDPVLRQQAYDTFRQYAYQWY